MDHSQNSNHDQHFNSSERDNANILLLEAFLKQTEGQKNILEAKVAKHDRVKAEMCDLQMKLDNLQRTIEDKKILHQQSYDEVNQELEATSTKYSQTLSTVEELEQNNHELECSIRCQSSKELQIVEKIHKQDILKTKTIECNNNIWDKINNEKVIFTTLLGNIQPMLCCPQILAATHELRPEIPFPHELRPKDI